eukprot:gene5565-biopygen20742
MLQPPREADFGRGWNGKHRMWWGDGKHRRSAGRRAVLSVSVSPRRQVAGWRSGQRMYSGQRRRRRLGPCAAARAGRIGARARPQRHRMLRVCGAGGVARVDLVFTVCSVGNDHRPVAAPVQLPRELDLFCPQPVSKFGLVGVFCAYKPTTLIPLPCAPGTNPMRKEEGGFHSAD